MSRERLKAMIEDAQRVAIFTGAGISTESGIPDFRSPGGVWSRMSPIYFQDFMASEEKRREAWDRAFSGRAGWTGKEPNAGHYAVSRLVASGKAHAVITQNVDNLHQNAGVPADRVVELHGNASYATCLDCAERHELAELKESFEKAGEIPCCRRLMAKRNGAVLAIVNREPTDLDGFADLVLHDEIGPAMTAAAAAN
jgi:NAD-dependent deacetylase